MNILLESFAFLIIFAALAYTRQPALSPAINRSGVAANQCEPIRIPWTGDAVAGQGVYLLDRLLAYTGQKDTIMSSQKQVERDLREIFAVAAKLPHNVTAKRLHSLAVLRETLNQSTLAGRDHERIEDVLIDIQNRYLLLGLSIDTDD